ncbi:hypothetical protein HYU14_06500 [Candidatus Woesearchaeota archaeon]|nr:hypothetical protein [Candidatus Woesearchaeota archaeon]
MKFISRKIIEIGRELSELDRFTFDFIRVLREHTPYVIVSGYVAILLGRSRASEDIDIFIPPMRLEGVKALVVGLGKAGFECIQAESHDEIFGYLKDKYAVRFARKNAVIPNIELKFTKTAVDNLTLKDAITVKIGKDALMISPLEMQIAFKEEILKSPKDIEDARHLRNIGEGHLDNGLIQGYRKMLHGLY